MRALPSCVTAGLLWEVEETNCLRLGGVADGETIVILLCPGWLAADKSRSQVARGIAKWGGLLTRY